MGVLLSKQANKEQWSAASASVWVTTSARALRRVLHPQQGSHSQAYMQLSAQH